MSWLVWALILVVAVVVAAAIVVSYRRAGRDFDQIVGEIDDNRADELAHRRRTLAERAEDDRRRSTGGS